MQVTSGVPSVCVLVAFIIALALGCNTGSRHLRGRANEELARFRSIAKDAKRIEVEVDCENSDYMCRYGPIVIDDVEHISRIADHLLAIDTLDVNDLAHSVSMGESARIIVIGQHPMRVYRLRMPIGDQVRFGDAETFYGRLPDHDLFELLKEIARDHGNRHPEDVIPYKR